MSEQLHVTGKSFTCYFAGKRPNGREYCRVLTSRRTYLRNRQFLVKTFIPHCCRIADHRNVGNVSSLLSLHQQSVTLSLIRKWCVSPKRVLSLINSDGERVSLIVSLKSSNKSQSNDNYVHFIFN